MSQCAVEEGAAETASPVEGIALERLEQAGEEEGQLGVEGGQVDVVEGPADGEIALAGAGV